jgi:hypothetical protein
MIRKGTTTNKRISKYAKNTMILYDFILIIMGEKSGSL